MTDEERQRAIASLEDAARILERRHPDRARELRDLARDLRGPSATPAASGQRPGPD